MQRQRRRTIFVFIALLLVQVLSPLAFAQAPDDHPAEDTDASVDLLQQLNIAPSMQAQHGWLNADEAASTAHLLYRDVALIAPSDWTDETGQQRVEGFHILGHTYPVPSSWFHDLAAAGIDCFSFMPPASFHCDVGSTTPAALAQLNVLGLAAMDATDKVQTDLVRGLLGLGHDRPQPLCESGRGRGQCRPFRRDTPGRDQPARRHRRGHAQRSFRHDGTHRRQPGLAGSARRSGVGGTPPVL